MIAMLLAVASCHTLGTPPLVVPDNGCTPGAYTRLTRAQVCTPKDRPTLPVADRWRILQRYGIPPLTWSGATGELDHRVPFFLGGTTTVRNVWPERGSIPNTKDRLENYVRVRICVRHTMRVRTGRAIFLADWRDAYRRYQP